MQSSGKWLTRTLAAGLIGSALFAGAAFGADGRMTAQRSNANRRVTSEGPRVVSFKADRTDSWLCENVSPFFCSAVPTVVSTPEATAASTSRGRGRR
jgi:hypothetical protein